MELSEIAAFYLILTFEKLLFYSKEIYAICSCIREFDDTELCLTWTGPIALIDKNTVQQLHRLLLRDTTTDQTLLVGNEKSFLYGYLSYDETVQPFISSIIENQLIDPDRDRPFHKNVIEAFFRYLLAVDINDGRYSTLLSATDVTKAVDTLEKGKYTSILLAYLLQYTSTGMKKIARWIVANNNTPSYPNLKDIATIVRNLGGKKALEDLNFDKTNIKSKFSIDIDDILITALHGIFLTVDE